MAHKDVVQREFGMSKLMVNYGLAILHFSIIKSDLFEGSDNVELSFGFKGTIHIKDGDGQVKVIILDVSGFPDDGLFVQINNLFKIFLWENFVNLLGDLYLCKAPLI